MATIAVIATLAVPAAQAEGHVSERGERAQAWNGQAVPGPVERVALSTPRSETCPDARKGLRYYQTRARYWAHKMGAGSLALMQADPKGMPCPHYLARVWKAKARAWRLRYERWHAYHYDWRSWLPDKWQRIGACETGYGRRPGNWRHSNSSYEGAFGFAKSSWDAFKYRADPKAGPYPADAWMATPRQQYEVALAIWRAYGFSGWGCRGA